MKSCFVIMPISTPEDSLQSYGGDPEHFMHVLDCLFTPAIEACDLQLLPPLVSGSEIIHGEIIRNLSSADLVLCDMSLLNANVFFEVGIRTALNKPVALVVDDVTIQIPFDTGIINYHRYSSALKGWLIKSEIAKLSGHLNKTLESEPDKNSLWKYFGISQTGSFDADQATSEDKMSLILRKLESITESDRAFYKPNADSNNNLPVYDDALAAFQEDYFKRLLTEVDSSSVYALAQRARMPRGTIARIIERINAKSKDS